MTHILDDLARWVAYHLPPRLVYWCAMRVAAHAVTGTHFFDEAPTMEDALDRWSRRHWGKPKRHWGWT